MKKITNKPKDWIKAFLVTLIGLTIFNIFADIDIFLELILVNIISALCGYILFEAINVLIYNKKIKNRCSVSINGKQLEHIKNIKFYDKYKLDYESDDNKENAKKL
jgi:hypothetical protein